MTYTHLIGIDPSLSTAGIAVYHPESGRLVLHTGDLFSCVSFLNNCGVLHQSIVIIEDPNKDSATFNMWFMFQKKLNVLLSGQRKSSFYAGAGSEKPVTLGDLKSEFSIALNHAQKVGMSKASATVFIELLKRQAVPTVRIAPSSRDRADKAMKKLSTPGIKVLSMPTKTTQEQFKTLTGYEARSNEHTRDAATLVHGRSISWAIGRVKLQIAQDNAGER
jgi:predicted Fe-Mo cluster-binding NifX family protein